MRWNSLLVVVVASLAVGGCFGSAPDPDRRGGAYVTLAEVPPSTVQIRLWITDGQFIDEAKLKAGTADWRVAVFGRVIRGTDADHSHGWQVDPALA